MHQSLYLFLKRPKYCSVFSVWSKSVKMVNLNVLDFINKCFMQLIFGNVLKFDQIHNFTWQFYFPWHVVVFGDFSKNMKGKSPRHTHYLHFYIFDKALKYNSKRMICLVRQFLQYTSVSYCHSKSGFFGDFKHALLGHIFPVKEVPKYGQNRATVCTTCHVFT